MFRSPRLAAQRPCLPLHRLSSVHGPANHAVLVPSTVPAIRRCATGQATMGQRAPPPPSSPRQSLLSPATTSPSSPSITAKISSQRTAQIARHLTSSSVHQSTRGLSTMASKYTTRKVAAANTLEHRVYIEKDGVPVSPFHDIPLYANQEQTILNMIVEIPRWSNAKLEVRLLYRSPRI